MKYLLSLYWILGMVACSSKSSTPAVQSCLDYGVDLPQLSGAQYVATPSNCFLEGEGTEMSTPPSPPQLRSNNPNHAPGQPVFVPGTCNIAITLKSQQQFTMTVRVVSLTDPICNNPTFDIHYFNSSGEEIPESALVLPNDQIDGGGGDSS